MTNDEGGRGEGGGKVKDSTAVVLRAASVGTTPESSGQPWEGRHRNPLGSPGRDDTGVLWAAREGRHGNPLGSPGRDDTGVLWAAPGGATLESSPGCNPGFARMVRRTPGCRGGKKSRRCRFGLEGMSPAAPAKAAAPAEAVFFPPLPGFWPLCLASPGGTRGYFPVSPLPGLPRGTTAVLSFTFPPPSSLPPSSFVIRHSSFVILHLFPDT